MSATDRYDVIVLGAGPSGAAAALQLARSGRRVLVIERKRFPRPKVCGGCLSGPALRHLRALLGNRRLPGMPGRRVTFVLRAYRLSCDPRGGTWMATRDELDQCLAGAAANAGAVFQFGRAGRLESDDAGWAVRVDGVTHRAATILAATGLGSLPQQIGIHGRARHAMFGQQWTQPLTPGLPRPGEVELHWLRGGYVGLAAPRSDLCIVALASRGPVHPRESAYSRLRRLNPASALWSVLGDDAPRRFAARGTAGFPWAPRRLGDANVLLIGDAAGYAEPYSGEGIAQALHSADCAARAIARGGSILRDYSAMMRTRHRRTLWRTSMISAILGRSVVHRLAAWPFLPQRVLARLVRHVHVTGAI